MKHRHITTPLLTLMLTLAACSKSTPTPIRGSLSDDDDDDPVTDTYDFTPELANDATRFSSPDLQINYNDGGVIALHDADAATYSLIDLTTGHRVDLSTSQPLSTTGVISARLSVDGNELPTEKITVERCIPSSAVWLSVTTVSGHHITLVLNLSN